MIDTHCHLDITDEHLEEYINKMENNIIIVSGADMKSNLDVIKLCERYHNIYGTIGFHPEESNNIKKTDLEFLENNIINPKIIGIGEIGLDYYWNKDNKGKQQELFIKQLEIAKKHHKTVVIHSRDAINETYEIMKQYPNLKMVLHCYSSSLEMALKFTKMNVKLGIGGVVTFKNASKLQEVVKNIDLSYLLLETDSPYLTPEPFRGMKNEPYNITLVAKKIAELKNTTIDNVYKTTTLNTISQFDLNIPL